jgi:hypothetical protein
MTKIGKFHSPYMPNDGHGPGVPLPARLHRWLCTLAGGEWPVELVIKSVSEMGPEGYSAEDHGDYIGIKFQPTLNSGKYHHWMGIKYEEIKDEGTSTA